MSEDLRYYFFDHEADEQPPVSPDEGWKNMQQLLDKEMPVTSKRRRYFFFIIATVAGIGLLTSLSLNNYFSPVTKHSEGITKTSPKQNSIVQGKNNSLDNEQPTQQENNIAANNDIALSLNDDAKSIKNKDKFTLKNTNSNTFTLQSNTVVASIDDPLNNNIVNASNDTHTTDEILVTDTAHVVFRSEKKDTEKEKSSIANSNTNKKQSPNTFDPRWQLNAGIGVNVSFANSLQSLRPYPYTELKYNFSKRFFAGASLGLFSPVGAKARGVEKTVYVNDTSYDVSSYNKMRNYKRLDYVDLALTAGVRINSKLSIQAGMQVSRLLHASTGTSLDPYDFNSNLVRTQGVDVSTLPVTPSAAPVYTNTIDVQKYDVRYLAGINYDLKKLSFGIQYQAAINPVLKGTIVSGDKSKMITLKAAYRFR